MKKISYIILLISILYACVEPYDFEVQETKRVLVIDASLTNEKRAHQVKLSEAYPLKNGLETPLSGAKVWVEDNQGNKTDFQETERGIYLTDSVFQGIIGNIYTLYVQTNDGSEFFSSPELLRNSAPIDSVYGKYDNRPSTEDDEILNGVQFYIANHNENETSSNYRFDFQEDYEISVPLAATFVWNPETGQLELPNESFEICYKQNLSSKLLIATTNGLTENRLPEVPIQFIRDSDDELRRKYSLTVRQYSISDEAYQFYKDLRENNESAGSFFDTQKGTVFGNIQKKGDASFPVLGYFEVAGVAKKFGIFTKQPFAEQGFRSSYFHITDSRNCVSDTALLNGSTDDYPNIADYLANKPDWGIYAVGMNSIFLSAPICNDCREHKGILKKPDFWD